MAQAARPRSLFDLWMAFLSRVAPRGDNALKPEPAGMLEDERAVIVVEMLVEAQTRRGAREQARQRRLAHSKRIAAKVIPVQLDQIERP